MAIDRFRSAVTRRPGWFVAAWVALAAVVGFASPDLTRLAAEGQAHLVDEDAESSQGARLIREAWPDQSFDSQVVVALHRPSGLTGPDRDYARKLAGRFDSDEGRPPTLLRVLGPDSSGAIAGRLVSPDKTLELVVGQVEASFVAPSTEVVVAWLQRQAAKPGLTPPAGLDLLWTGDAVIGRDYMRDVQTSLDRAALATVVLLLGVLLRVYRSFLLALVPLSTIGLCLVISRGLLGWLAKAGWEVSPLVELFLIVVLFGSGTDFCLFVSWRFGEHWDAKNPAAAMRVTLRRGATALITSAGTVFVGLMLMGTTRFKLFSSTGPSVALGLVITLAASLTLAPALLVLLARWRPQSFHGMTGPGSGFWDRFAHRVLARPLLSWSAALAVMVPLAVLGTQTTFTQDTLLEMPASTPSAEALRLVGRKFGPGVSSPLTVVLQSAGDLRDSRGLALIDDLGRTLASQKGIGEVRSATRPLGSTAPLDPARLSARLAAVDDGLKQIGDGANRLRVGLEDGLTKLQSARWLEGRTGLQVPRPGEPSGADSAEAKANREALANGFRKAGSFLLGGGRAAPTAPNSPSPEKPNPTLAQIGEAVNGAGKVAEGVRRAAAEVSAILADPVSRQALDRLLITPETLRDHPELQRSFDAYLSADGKLARIDLSQKSRVFSAEAMDQVIRLRGKIRSRLDDEEEGSAGVVAVVAGPNAESADVRTLTRSDQVQSWFVIPIGVFIVLIVALRDPMACLNLVATMLLTYLFALGATHLVFITLLGAEGLDWKVPYFLFVLLVAVGVDYNVFLMARLREEIGSLGLRAGIGRAVAQTGGLISSAAAITAVSFASFLFSPLGSLRQLGFALVVGIAVDAVIVRPLLVPCGHWLLNRHTESRRMGELLATPVVEPFSHASQ